MAPPTVRPTSAADGPLLRELRLEALRTHPTAFSACLAEAEARPLEWWRDTAAAGAGSGVQVIIVATVPTASCPTGEPAAMAGVFTPPQPKIAHTGTIWGVYTRAAHRGRGVGTAVVSACIAWARGRGLLRVKLSVVEGNDSARRCYERLGFEPYGREPDVIRWEGRLYGETHMTLRL